MQPPLGWILLLVVTRNSSLAVMSNLPSPINIYMYLYFLFYYSLLHIYIYMYIFFFNPLGLNYCCAECLLKIIFMVNVVWWIDEYRNFDSWDGAFCRLLLLILNRHCCLSIIFGDYTVIGCNWLVIGLVPLMLVWF